MCVYVYVCVCVYVQITKELNNPHHQQPGSTWRCFRGRLKFVFSIEKNKTKDIGGGMKKRHLKTSLKWKQIIIFSLFCMVVNLDLSFVTTMYETKEISRGKDKDKDVKSERKRKRLFITKI